MRGGAHLPALRLGKGHVAVHAMGLAPVSAAAPCALLGSQQLPCKQLQAAARSSSMAKHHHLAAPRALAVERVAHGRLPCRLRASMSLEVRAWDNQI